MCGGYDGVGYETNACSRLSSDGREWQFGPFMQEGKRDAAMAVDSDGKLYVSGGEYRL